MDRGPCEQKQTIQQETIITVPQVYTEQNKVGCNSQVDRCQMENQMIYTPHQLVKGDQVKASQGQKSMVESKSFVSGLFSTRDIF